MKRSLFLIFCGDKKVSMKRAPFFLTVSILLIGVIAEVRGQNQRPMAFTRAVIAAVGLGFP